MEVSAKFETNQAWVMTTAHVSKLWSYYSALGMRVYLSAACSDGITRKFNTCEQLVSYENAKRSAIVSVELSARSADSLAEIAFARRYSPSVSATFAGDETFVTDARTRLEDLVDDTRAWYSKLATFESYFLWVVVVLLAQLLPGCGLHPSTINNSGLAYVAEFMLMVGSIFMLTWLTNRLRKIFFPVSTFAIGQGLTRHRNAEKIRWGVIVATTLSVAVSMVMTWLWK